MRSMRLAGCLWLLAMAVGCGTENQDASIPASETVSIPDQTAPSASETETSNSVNSALDDLVLAFRQRRPEQWKQAESAIHAQGTEALPMLLDGLGSSDRQTRELAAMMLAQVLPNLLYSEDAGERPDANHLAGTLRQALDDESVEVRVNIAVALSLIPGEGPQLIPVFEELLKSDLPHVRTMAVAALGGLGPLAESSIPEIERLSETDADPAVKSAALEALGQVRAIR